MAWRKQWLTGRLVNGYDRIDIVFLARNAGAILISVDGLVTAVFDEHVSKGSMCSIFRSTFVRLVPPASHFLTGDELEKYIRILSEAIKDVYRLSVDICD
jgi:hypothetical protein